MSKAEKMRQWLAGWNEDFIWLVDCLGKKSGAAAVFPQGTKQLVRREDILGDVRRRFADTYALKLRLAASGEADAAHNAAVVASLEGFAGCPVFGERQTVRLEHGKLGASDGSTAVYTATLTVEYEV